MLAAQSSPGFRCPSLSQHSAHLSDSRNEQLTLTRRLLHFPQNPLDPSSTPNQPQRGSPSFRHGVLCSRQRPWGLGQTYFLPKVPWTVSGTIKPTVATQMNAMVL